MSVIMDNRIESMDREEDVKKLQELVKELRLQNEELRSERQTLLSKTKVDKSIEENEKEKNDIENKDKLKSDTEKPRSRPTSIDSIPLDISVVLGSSNLPSDDETWLYDSPNIKSETQNWLRKDLDDPTLGVVKKSLVNKLDEIANSPRHSPRHSLYSPSSSSGVLSPESPPSSRGEFDSRTFIRPKKKRSSPFDVFNDENRNTVIEKEANRVPRSRNGSREYLGRSNGSLGSEEDDRMSSASDGSYSSFKLTDVEDVNALARLQEESLKSSAPRSMNRISPGVKTSTPSSTVRLKTGSSGESAASSQEDLLTSPLGSQSNMRRPIIRSGLQPPRRYPTVGLPHPASRENSDMSTPPDSPYNSQNNLETYNAHGRIVSSRLPSLTRKLGGSDSHILDRSSGGSQYNSKTVSPMYSQEARSGSAADVRTPVRTSRLQAPQSRPSRLSAPSPVRIPMGTPQISDIPKATNSGMPKTGSRLQPPRSRQMSQSPVKPAGSQPSDWREGCY